MRRRRRSPRAKRVMIRKMLADQHEVEVAETSRRGHATRLAHAAANDGLDVVRGPRGRRHAQRRGRWALAQQHRARPAPRRVDKCVRTHPRLSQRGRRRRGSSCSRHSHAMRPSASVSDRRTGARFSSTRIGFDAAVIRRVERYGELKRYMSHRCTSRPRSRRSSQRRHGHVRRHRA